MHVRMSCVWLDELCLVGASRLDPIRFVAKRLKAHGPIFATRLMNKYTIVVCCQQVPVLTNRVVADCYHFYAYVFTFKP
jgi:hypothetical protein